MQAASVDEIRACESDDRNPAKIVERQEGAGRAVQLLGLLPENQQEVIRLRFQNGLSYKEIAGVTKLSVSNVGYLIHTAIRTIRARIASACGVERARVIATNCSRSESAKTSSAKGRPVAISCPPSAGAGYLRQIDV